MTDAVSERYERFARDEAPGRSPIYAQWAAGIVDDPEMRRMLQTVSEQHRQPALVFAVSRLCGAPVGDYEPWRSYVLRNAATIAAECERRGIQTNEPLRLAALLPALSQIDGPIALLEIGAAAGFCLYPDRYSYRFADANGADRLRLDPDAGRSDVLLTSVVRGELPPLQLPQIMWRAGLDLDPIDVRDAQARAWVEALIWPGERDRAQRIAAAIDVVAADPPMLVAGDALDELDALVASAPPEATLVITTPGVLVYLPRARRLELIERIRAHDARWVTIDHPGLHDGWHPTIDPSSFSGFAVALDGRVYADADPLGRWWEWRGGALAAGG